MKRTVRCLIACICALTYCHSALADQSDLKRLALQVMSIYGVDRDELAKLLAGDGRVSRAGGVLEKWSGREIRVGVTASADVPARELSQAMTTLQNSFAWAGLKAEICPSEENKNKYLESEFPGNPCRTAPQILLAFGSVDAGQQQIPFGITRSQYPVLSKFIQRAEEKIAARPSEQICESTFVTKDPDSGIVGAAAVIWQSFREVGSRSFYSCTDALVYLLLGVPSIQNAKTTTLFVPELLSLLYAPELRNGDTRADIQEALERAGVW